MNGKVLGLIPSNTHTTPTYNPGHKTQPGHWLPRLLRSISCKTSWRQAGKRTYEHRFFFQHSTQRCRDHFYLTPLYSVRAKVKMPNSVCVWTEFQIEWKIMPPASKTTTTANKITPTLSIKTRRACRSSKQLVKSTLTVLNYTE